MDAPVAAVAPDAGNSPGEAPEVVEGQSQSGQNRTERPGDGETHTEGTQEPAQKTEGNFPWGSSEKTGSPVCVLVRAMGLHDPLNQGAQNSKPRQQAMDQVVQNVHTTVDAKWRPKLDRNVCYARAKVEVDRFKKKKESQKRATTTGKYPYALNEIPRYFFTLLVLMGSCKIT